jgi:hypothetical protein
MTDLVCPNCPAPPGLAEARQRALEARRAAAPPMRDPLMFALHLAFAGSLLCTIVSWRALLWVVPLATLELAAAVSALVPWRGVRALIHARAGLYATIAAGLFMFEIGSPMLFLLLLAHAAAVWAFARGAVARGAGASVPLVAPGGVAIPLLAVLGEASRGNAREARSWVRALTLMPAAITWLFLIAGLRALAP